MSLQTSLNTIHTMMRQLRSPPKMVEYADDTIIALHGRGFDEAALSAVKRVEIMTPMELVRALEAIAEFERITEAGG